jgi:hypothetical protein
MTESGHLAKRRNWASQLGLLQSEPRYCKIDACGHCHWGNDPHTPCPEPVQAIWQKAGNEADHERADRGRSSPTVPIHFGREEIQNGIGKIPGTVHAQKNDALRGIDGKQREPARPRNDIEERERCPKGKREATNCRSGYHDPKPLISFMT